MIDSAYPPTSKAQIARTHIVIGRDSDSSRSFASDRWRSQPRLFPSLPSYIAAYFYHAAIVVSAEHVSWRGKAPAYAVWPDSLSKRRVANLAYLGTIFVLPCPALHRIAPPVVSAWCQFQVLIRFRPSLLSGRYRFRDGGVCARERTLAVKPRSKKPGRTWCSSHPRTLKIVAGATISF